MPDDQNQTPVRPAPPAIAPEPLAPKREAPPERPLEFGGPTGLEPTRYGDWERKGRCVDF